MYTLDVTFTNGKDQSFEFKFWDDAEDFADTLSDVHGWGIYHNGSLIEWFVDDEDGGYHGGPSPHVSWERV